MHPGYESNAILRAVCVQAQLVDGFRGGHDRLTNDLHRYLRGCAERAGDRSCVLLHLLQRFRTVEMLASGSEPSFEAGKIDHFLSSPASAALLTRTSHGAYSLQAGNQGRNSACSRVQSKTRNSLHSPTGWQELVLRSFAGKRLIGDEQTFTTTAHNTNFRNPLSSIFSWKSPRTKAIPGLT